MRPRRLPALLLAFAVPFVFLLGVLYSLPDARELSRNETLPPVDIPNQQVEQNLLFPPKEDAVPSSPSPINTPPNRSRVTYKSFPERANAVREAYKFTFQKYKEFVWGEDELRPLSKKPNSWGGIGLSIVDSLDTAILMDLREEVDEGIRWITEHLNYSKYISISVFEVTIRELGGLLSAHYLTENPNLLRKAVELADILVKAFETPSGLPYTTINLGSGKGTVASWMGNQIALSEAGTMQMEFIYLSHLTGDMKYAKAAHRVIQVCNNLEKTDGLYSVHLRFDDAKWGNDQRVTLGALGDSFYEYLLKVWLMTGKRASLYEDMYDESSRGIIKHLVKQTTPSNYTYIIESATRSLPISPIHKMDHLVCFAGGMFGLAAHAHPSKWSAQLEPGAGVTEICYKMYTNTKTGLAPEIIKFRPEHPNEDFYSAPDASHNLLRPEAVEAYYIMYMITGDPKYQEWGWQVFQAFEKHCRTPNGYSGLRNIDRLPIEHDDLQQSFFMAETLKYLYLLFTPERLSIDEVIFNTEAHPFPVFTPSAQLLEIITAR